MLEMKKTKGENQYFGTKIDTVEGIYLDKTHHPLICDSPGNFVFQLVFFFSRKIPEHRLRGNFFCLWQLFL